MFAAIARSYDLNNRLHSLWQDQAWRRFAVRKAEVRAGDRVLDVACGTGDLTLAFAKTQAAEVVGLDFTAEMLEIAREKSRVRGKRERGEGESAGSQRVRYVQGDAHDLAFDDASFDVVSIAFGIRNVQEPARAMREFRRVLRPGGRLVVLEFAEPGLSAVRWFNGVYCRRVMPVTATLISGDKSGAYKYLPRSVETFMSPDDLKGLMTSVGFVEPLDWPLSLGICRCYRACATG